MWPRRIPDEFVRALARIHEIHAESGGNDAETLARMFEDDRLGDEDSVEDRVSTILDATAHRWLAGRSFVLDVPGLYELKGFSDRGFRPELRDPWPGSRDQVGHILTALALSLRAGLVRRKRFGLSLRSLAGAPSDLPDDEVALRFAIGHEKAPDPGRYDPLMLLKVRRQFATASAADVGAFRDAVEEAASRATVDVARLAAQLEAIRVGDGMGNSRQDLTLTALGAVLAAKVRRGDFPDRHAVAAWVRRNLAG